MKITHATGKWIFKRVDSAGYNKLLEAVASGLPEPPVPSIVAQACESAGSFVSRSYRSWAFGFPHEVNRIMTR